MGKYSLTEKEKIVKEHFTSDNIILRPLTGMKRLNSKVDDDVIENRKLIYELLELEGGDVIRFAIARDGDCTCKSFASDDDDMINLRNLLLKAYPLEEYPMED